MGQGALISLTRRGWLGAAAALPLAACTRSEAPSYTGGWVGAQHERGHRLRDLKSGHLPEPSVQRRADVLVVGAGIAGLAAARALSRAGVADVHVFDLEDSAGGNSRGHRIAGMACPLGAHYLPTPGEHAVEVAEWLEEIGLRRSEHGRVVYDERHLCASPQERLFIDGVWHEGLLPPIDALPAEQRATTLAQYRRFAALLGHAAADRRAFTLPTARSRWSPALDALDAQTFAQWLDAQGLDAPALRWYLDYCCRDDYGAGAAQVSAWAGLHYFASRHGFRAPGETVDEHDGVLTWPEGNAWLSQRLAAPLNERLHAGQLALRVSEGRHETSVDLWNEAAQRVERWTAPQLILATPLFVSARLLDAVPAALQQVAAQHRYAPWLVANLHLAEPLTDRPGAPPSWDNVGYQSDSLGYVDAMHQSTRVAPGPTVLTSYWALGGDSPAQAQAGRKRLLDEPWSVWTKRVVDDLARAHADLAAKLRHIDLMRYGHAMSVPVPGLRSSTALQALAAPQGRVHFAHSDLAAYSVFEEAFFHGHRAGQAAAQQLIRRASKPRSPLPPPARRG